MDVLDLDSQIQLLSRIQFLTRFSSNFVQITGEQGAGKTWLSECYLDAWANDPIQSLLICNSNQQDPQHRAIILRQLVRSGIFNEENTILQSLDQMLKGQTVHALIVIDDAHRLSANIVAELWALISEAQRRDGWQINVLLFSLPGKLNKWLHKLSSGQGKKPLELEISPLTENERDMFIDLLMVSRKMDAASRRVLKQKALSLPPLPGLLMGLGSLEASSMDKKKPASRWVMIILIVLLVIVAGALAWLILMPKTAEVDKRVALPNSAETLSMEDDSLMSQALFPDELIMPNDVVLEETALDNTVQDDTSALSPAITIEGMTVGRNDKNRREVVVPENVVEAIIEEQQMGEEALVFSESSFIPEQIVETTIESVQPESAVSLSEIAAPFPDTLDVPLANQMLLAVPVSHYALQLAALKSELAVNDFIKEHGLQNQVFVYETRREGVPWFMVLFDTYLNVADARRAEKQLPGNLRALSPWPKSFTRIHQEIKIIK